MIKHQTNSQEVNKQLSKINVDYVQIIFKKQYVIGKKS